MCIKQIGDRLRAEIGDQAYLRFRYICIKAKRDKAYRKQIGFVEQAKTLDSCFIFTFAGWGYDYWLSVSEQLYHPKSKETKE